MVYIPKDFIPWRRAWAIISLGSLPGTDRKRAASRRPKTASSLLGLAPGGGCLAARIAADAGGLLHHLFTIATLTASHGEKGAGRQSVSVALFRQVTPPRVLPGAALFGVRTFLDPLPKQRTASARPT